MVFDTKAEKPETLEMPANIGFDTCYLMEPIKFLNAKTVLCLKTVNELCKYNSLLMRQLFNSQLFRRPSKMTETREAADVLSINIQSCKHAFLNCTQILANEDAAEELELLGDEMFDEVRFQFVINDTSIVSLNVTFVSHEELLCGIDEFGPLNAVQKVEVRFKNVNDNREKRIRKRSRGYNDLELILASRLRPVNETVPDGETVLDYFRNDTKDDVDFHMKIPDVISEKCVLNDHVYDVIRFKEHSRTVCTVELARDGKINETFCQQFQRQIIYFLFNTMNLTANYTQDVFVSRFWTPRYDLGSWTPVNMLNIPPWNPEMRETEKTFSCSNIATAISYSIYSSRVRPTSTRKYENVIEYIEVDFTNTKEIKFPIESENQTDKVDITVQIQFIFAKSKENDGKMLFSEIKIFFYSFLVLRICIDLAI